jgi:hypothetical protein
MTWTKKDKGWCPLLPRIVPLVSTLAKVLAPKGKGDPSSTYVDLWFRTDDDGFVEVEQVDEFAWGAGFITKRGRQSWRERVVALAEMGFIRVKPRLSQDMGFILLLHPVRVVEELKHDSRYRIPQDWLECYTNRLREMGNELS